MEEYYASEKLFLYRDSSRFCSKISKIQFAWGEEGGHMFFIPEDLMKNTEI